MGLHAEHGASLKFSLLLLLPPSLKNKTTQYFGTHSRHARSVLTVGAEPLSVNNPAGILICMEVGKLSVATFGGTTPQQRSEEPVKEPVDSTCPVMLEK